MEFYSDNETKFQVEAFYKQLVASVVFNANMNNLCIDLYGITLTVSRLNPNKFISVDGESPEYEGGSNAHPYYDVVKSFKMVVRVNYTGKGFNLSTEQWLLHQRLTIIGWVIMSEFLKFMYTKNIHSMHMGIKYIPPINLIIVEDSTTMEVDLSI